ncbi:hypothetical protein PIB30_067932 [Stylosanthes scabra]|uniref:Uncharacterized protein n=1 Tax=Stylosanthes scabra TaxID=79078 RepID=A0ABU6UPX5_9FABA|nr:hypothetical protein [Stylosanthes scabra]
MVTSDSVHGNMHESRNQHLNVSTQPPQTPIQPPEPPISAESVAPKRPGAASSSNGLPSDASNSINPQTDCTPRQNTTGTTTPTPASCEVPSADYLTQYVPIPQENPPSRPESEARATPPLISTGDDPHNQNVNTQQDAEGSNEGEEHLDEDARYHCYESEELHSIASDDDGQPDVFPQSNADAPVHMVCLELGMEFETIAQFRKAVWKFNINIARDIIFPRVDSSICKAICSARIVCGR